MPEANLVVADRFRLVRELGRGGMGSVWLAHHMQLDIPCAVKFIESPAVTEEARARFATEARAAAALRSPHVVQVLDTGTWQDMPYIAMELLEGEELSMRLERLGKLPPRVVLELVGQAARALTKAHGLGIVHRDLKPDNLFIVRDEDRELVKILDFGIAKFVDPLATGVQTRTGSVMGTPYYMSPEQAKGSKAIDHRSDVWSLGVIVYECLTGFRPFDSDSLGDLILRIVSYPIPTLRERAPELPEAVEAFWQRASAREPDQRYQSVRELVDGLAEALGEAPAAGARESMVSVVSAHEAAGPLQRPVTLGDAARTVGQPPPTPQKGKGAVIGVAVAAAAVVLAGVGFLALRGGSQTSPATDGAAPATSATPPEPKAPEAASAEAPPPAATAASPAARPEHAASAEPSAAAPKPAAPQAPATTKAAKPVGAAKPPPPPKAGGRDNVGF